MHSQTAVFEFFAFNEPKPFLDCIIGERLSQIIKKGCEIINISCEQIIAEYSDLVYRIAITHVKDKEDAEDIFQEVFISLIKNLDTLENKQHLEHWLIRATINRSKNYNLCFWKRKVELYQEEIEVSSSDDTNLMIAEVRDVISTLDPKLRSVVYLYYYEGYSVNEIATVLKVPAGTVKSRLHSARGVLKNELKEVYRNEI